MYNPVDPVRQQLGWYMRNCAMSSAAAQIEDQLLEWLPFLQGIAEHVDSPAKGERSRRGASMGDLHNVLLAFDKPGIDSERFEQNSLFVRDEFELDEIESEILLLLIRYQHNELLEVLVDKVVDKLGNVFRSIAVLIGRETREVYPRITPKSSLVAGGILTFGDENYGRAGGNGFPRLAPLLRKTMFRTYCSRAEWAEDLFGAPVYSKLQWRDYEHLGEARELAASILAGVASQNAKGINILIHGPVGTGKTEFCKTLAAQSGLTLWSVGESDDQGGEPTRHGRLASLRLAQRLLKCRGNAVILFDEAEDLFAHDVDPLFGLRMRGHEGSRAHLNRMIEMNQVPVLWTCSDLDYIDSAVLRRMTLVIETNTPNLAVRTRIWQRVLTESSLNIDVGTARRLAGRYKAPPAICANAARAAALARGGEHEIAEAMDGLLSVLGISPSLTPADGDNFDLHLVNCVENLEEMVTQLCRAGAPRNWSLCLDGLPGTGKSQFASHLANKLGMDVIQKRASELLSRWAGESERKIARAFATARAQKAMLVFDEADSFLYDRRTAERSWEVTQLNEMLTWMEYHPLPFVCTTNLMNRLDQASLRRFTFKLDFKALDLHQSAQAFRHFFGIEAPCPLPDGLTAGDFATVRRKCDIYRSVSADRILDWLEQEIDAKQGRPARFGFVPVSAGRQG